MTPFDHRLDRTLVIHASPETVFSFFTDSARWAAWWGAGSSIDARPGGKMHIRYPNNVEAGGEVLEVIPPQRIVMTFGYVQGQPMGPGDSRLTIRLEPVALGTRLLLTHEFSEAGVRDQHVQGWRYQLSVFANAVADLVHRDAATVVDDWFAVWREPKAAARLATLERIATADVRFRNHFSALETREDVEAHIAASQRFMPDMRLERHGELRQCQGVVLVDWTARDRHDAETMRGVNVFELDGEGRIRTVTGFVTPPPRT